MDDCACPKARQDEMWGARGNTGTISSDLDLRRTGKNQFWFNPLIMNTMMKVIVISLKLARKARSSEGMSDTTRL